MPGTADLQPTGARELGRYSRRSAVRGRRTDSARVVKHLRAVLVEEGGVRALHRGDGLLPQPECVWTVQLMRVLVEEGLVGLCEVMVAMFVCMRMCRSGFSHHARRKEQMVVESQEGAPVTSEVLLCLRIDRDLVVTGTVLAEPGIYAPIPPLSSPS